MLLALRNGSNRALEFDGVLGKWGVWKFVEGFGANVFERLDLSVAVKHEDIEAIAAFFCFCF